MNISRRVRKITDDIYKKVRATGKKYYLKKTAKRDTDSSGSKLSAEQKKEIRQYYTPYCKPDLVYHQLYLQLTGRFDVRYIPDDIFSNVIDRFYNDSRRAFVLENKCYFDKMFEDIRLPATIASRMNGFWYSASSGATTLERLMQEIEGRTVVIKQAWGSFGGHSVVFMEGCKADSLAKTFSEIKEDIIIQEPIVQHDDLARINPTSVNTVRVLSLLTKKEVRILSCFLRCGRKGSRVDNTSSGGFACGIDPNGFLKKYAYTRNDYTNAVTAHPDSDVSFEGIQIPSWDKLIALVKKAHPQIPHFRMVSWDITIDRDGDPVLVEANLNDGVNRTHQVLNGPVFGDLTEDVLKEVFGKP